MSGLDFIDEFIFTPANGYIARPMNDKYAELTALFLAGTAGDAGRYNQFLQQATGIFRRVLAKRLPPDDIEDVVQNILISVHKARHTYDGDRPLMPWLLSIAAFRVNDHLRRAYARAGREVDIGPVIENLAADVTFDAFEGESVEELLADVPERQKNILTLMYVEGYTAKETGQKLNMKESAVKVAAFRALRKIRERLQQ